MIMKKFTLLFLFFTLTTHVFSQGTQRMVLWEEFTSGSCPPCASVNPQITNYWNNNPDKVVGIQYHMSWPLANDPMYLNNPDDNNARRGVYGVNSIPHASIDGDRYSGTAWNMVNTLINLTEDTYNEVSSSFDLQLNYELNDAKDQLTITAIVTAVEPVSNLNAKLYLPVIEKHIHLSSSQPNGEQDFYNVMKALVPSSSGTTLPSNWNQNDYELYQFTWDVFGFYNIDEIGLIGFIQNTGASPLIQQAGYGTSDPVSPNYDIDVATINIETPQVSCNNVVSPIVTIRNQGADDITEATIKYSINDGEEMIYQWNGNLSFMESESIELDPISFETAASYDIKVVVENPNNSNDEYTKNDEFIINIPQSAFLPQNCKVAILTDVNPQETTWDIKNSAGEVIASGGPYDVSSIYIEPFTWPANDCYTFTMYDAGGDGMSSGFYKIVNSSNQTIWEGDIDFGSMANAEFAFDEVMGIETSLLNEEFSVYPNPVVNTAQVDFSLLQQSTVQLGIYNILGKRIIQIYSGKMPLGQHRFDIESQDLENGVYFVKLNIDGVESTQKIQILK